MGIIEVNGTAKRDVDYDVAVIGIEFTAREKNAFDASTKAMKNCESFLAAVEKLGLSASSFSLNEDKIEEDYYEENNHFLATRGLLVKLPFDMEMINNIRALLDENKSNSRFNLDYEIANVEEITNDLLKEALLDSKKKAESLAAAIGQTIKGIDTVSSYGHGGGITKRCSYEMEDASCMYKPMLTYDKSNELQAKKETFVENIQVKWIVE